MRGSLLRRMAAGTALALAGAAGTHAYVTHASWAAATTTFYVNPANADVSSDAAITALRTGMSSWNGAGTPFRLEYGGTTNDTTTSFDNRNVIIFRPNYSSGSTIAYTYTWKDSSNRLLDADITFYTTDWTFHTGSTSCAASKSVYIEDVAAHEFGHAIGIKHSAATDATMYPSTTSCNQSWRSLASDDISAVRSLYGTGSSNTAPSITLSSPTSGLSVLEGTSLTFTGSASDSQDGNLTSSIQWTDNGTAIGTGGSFSRLLTVGTHTIVARVTDSGGLQASRQVGLTVNVASLLNTAPTVTLSSPASGASFAQGAVITFGGAASDTQDGNLTSSLKWNANGVAIGTGGSFTKTLAAGTYTITARATDAGGLQGSKQVTITVASSTSSPNLSAKGTKVKGLQQTALSWNGFSATSIDVYRNNVKVMQTANDGSATDNINVKGTGTYSYKACAAGTSTCSSSVAVTF